MRGSGTISLLLFVALSACQPGIKEQPRPAPFDFSILESRQKCRIIHCIHGHKLMIIKAAQADSTIQADFTPRGWDAFQQKKTDSLYYFIYPYQCKISEILFNDKIMEEGRPLFRCPLSPLYTYFLMKSTDTGVLVLRFMDRGEYSEFTDLGKSISALEAQLDSTGTIDWTALHVQALD